MQVLKGKKKIIFFLILFLFLTTYEIKNENNLPLFKIKHVQFVNNNNLEENIKDKIINYLNNKSLLNINNKKISSFLSKSQWVRNFKINRNYPNRIILQINEFKPIAVFLKNDKLYFINSNFEITNKVVTRPNSISRIQVSGLYQREIFKKKFSEIKKFEIYHNIKSINILHLNRLDIYLKNNTNVKLGDYDINLQMITLTKVVEKYKNLNSIDLRNKGRVVIK
tara:strand:+ start:4973 stop:5644 length:672 start_codon:yes stop_codon:yes gene_type:complete